MDHIPEVRRFQAGDTPAAAAIIRGLPDYFTDDVPAKAEPDAASRPYEATRAFWERNAASHIDTIDPLPGWQAGNPAGIYVAAIRPTR
jgi:hypothetical protein